MYNLNEVTGCEVCTHGWENFKTLSPEELLMVNENRYEAHFKPGEIIFKKGSPCTSAVFLVSGKAKIFLEGFNGKNLIISIAGPGRLIAGPGSYVDNRHHYSVATIEEVRACFINMDIIKQLVHTNSKFAEGMLKDLSFKSLKNFYSMISLSQKKMHGRLAEGLLYLANEVYESEEFELQLSRQEIGDLTGMAKENVVRILKEFHDDGILATDCPNIKILDKKRLERISETG